MGYWQCLALHTCSQLYLTKHFPVFKEQIPSIKEFYAAQKRESMDLHVLKLQNCRSGRQASPIVWRAKLLNGFLVSFKQLAEKVDRPWDSGRRWDVLRSYQTRRSVCLSCLSVCLTCLPACLSAWQLLTIIGRQLRSLTATPYKWFLVATPILFHNIIQFRIKEL